MTKWKGPDGRVTDDRTTDMSVIVGRYYTRRDFDNDLDKEYGDRYGYIYVLDYGFTPSYILEKLAPMSYEDEYQERLKGYASKPEALGLKRVADSSASKKSACSGCRGGSSCSRCVKKKTTASKPKSGTKKTTSNQRKPKSGGGRR